jgi:hypothetical protein
VKSSHPLFSKRVIERQEGLTFLPFYLPEFSPQQKKLKKKTTSCLKIFLKMPIKNASGICCKHRAPTSGNVKD